MRTMFLILLSVISMFTYAQSAKVCGIPFGSSYMFVEGELKFRCGEDALCQKSKNEITYYDFDMGNYLFDSASFGFQYDDSGKSYFSYAFFSANYDLSQKDRALSLMKSLSMTLAAKYPDLISRKDDSGEEFYLCGTNPKDEGVYLIKLYIVKDKSKGGDWYYYVNLDYGPINYVNPVSDF